MSPIFSPRTFNEDRDFLFQETIKKCRNNVETGDSILKIVRIISDIRILNLQWKFIERQTTNGLNIF